MSHLFRTRDDYEDDHQDDSLDSIVDFQIMRAMMEDEAEVERENRVLKALDESYENYVDAQYEAYVEWEYFTEWRNKAVNHLHENGKVWPTNIEDIENIEIMAWEAFEKDMDPLVWANTL